MNLPEHTLSCFRLSHPIFLLLSEAVLAVSFMSVFSCTVTVAFMLWTDLTHVCVRVILTLAKSQKSHGISPVNYADEDVPGCVYKPSCWAALSSGTQRTFDHTVKILIKEDIQQVLQKAARTLTQVCSKEGDYFEGLSGTVPFTVIHFRNANVFVNGDHRLWKHREETFHWMQLCLHLQITKGEMPAPWKWQRGQVTAHVFLRSHPVHPLQGPR